MNRNRYRLVLAVLGPGARSARRRAPDARVAQTSPVHVSARPSKPRQDRPRARVRRPRRSRPPTPRTSGRALLDLGRIGPACRRRPCLPARRCSWRGPQASRPGPTAGPCSSSSWPRASRSDVSRKAPDGRRAGGDRPPVRAGRLAVPAGRPRPALDQAKNADAPVTVDIADQERPGRRDGPSRPEGHDQRLRPGQIRCASSSTSMAPVLWTPTRDAADRESGRGSGQGRTVPGRRRHVTP